MTTANTNEITFSQWTTEAGPRQTKEVEKALQALRYAGQGTEVISTSFDGKECHMVEYSPFSPSPEEEAHKLERIKHHNKLHKAHGGLITRENFRQVIADTLPIIETLEALQPVRDERRTPEKVAADNAERIEKARLQNLEYKQKEEARAAAANALEAEYPYLNRVDNSGGGTEAAKNIRIVLKREFPGVKFSVRSEYSRVSVDWTDGPTVESVDSKLINFKAGSFDGMTDCYNYSRDAFNDAFGSVQYLFTSRSYRDGLKENIRYCIEKVTPGNMEPYEIDRQTNKALAAADLTGKGDFTGLQFDYEEQRYILEFKETAKTPVKTPTATASGNPSGQTYTIEEHTHTKKEKQYFLCIAADRMEREVFNAERDRAKDCGGWYSRAWQGTPGGFAFWTEAEAQAFAGLGGGGETPDGEETEKLFKVKYENLNTGEHGEHFPEPVTHAEACTLLGKLTCHDWRRSYLEAHAPKSPQRERLFNQVKSVLAVQRPDLEEEGLMLKVARVVERTNLDGKGDFRGIHFEASEGWVVDFKETATGPTPDGGRTNSMQNMSPLPTKEMTAIRDAGNKAEKLRTMADKLKSQIADKRTPSTQNMTPKRSLERQSRLIDADLLERVQTALYAIANGLEAGTYTGKVPTKKDLLTYLQTRTDHSGGYYSLSDTGTYSDTSPEAVKIQTLLSSAKTPEQEAEEQERKTAQLIESKEAELIGQRIPGFFVTHKETAARVIAEADIQPGETVLEPEAGTGNLADLAREAGGKVFCYEIRPSLAEILRLKGHTVECDDFLDYMVDYPQYKFDKIVMNPPFENGQDGDHVRHAYNFLKEGGRLVAIMGEGTFYRSDSKATAFREWLEDVGGVSEKLPEGSFAGGGEVNRTGTATRIVVINK